MRTECIVCGAPLVQGYRGRPRVVCSRECYNRRRVLRAENQANAQRAKDSLLRAVGALLAWPDLQLTVAKLAQEVNELSDEVTDSQSTVEKIHLGKELDLVDQANVIGNRVGLLLATPETTPQE